MSQSHFLWFLQLPPEGSSDDWIHPLQWINKHAHTHFAMIAFCQYLIYLPSWKMAYIPLPSLQLLSFKTESFVRQLRHCFPPYNMYLLSKWHPVPACAIVELPRLQRVTIFLFKCWCLTDIAESVGVWTVRERKLPCQYTKNWVKRSDKHPLNC